jgi:hypothetical protein
LKVDVVNDIQLPRKKAREWMKVLTLDQILDDKNRFCIPEQVNHMFILEEAL